MEEKQTIVLELKKVSRVYGSGMSRITAVDSVDLQVYRGEIVLVMGPSGSGKTTLLTMGGGLLRPTSGEVLVMGRDIWKLSELERVHLRRHVIGFVFQSFNLLSALSAVENVEVPMQLAGQVTAAARRRAVQLLEEFGLGQRLQARPAQLSGGEKQRVAIARALANDPELILADEPTANLDSQRGAELIQALQGSARSRGKTLVIVSHDHRIRNIADRLLWMEDGRFRQEPATATG